MPWRRESSPPAARLAEEPGQQPDGVRSLSVADPDGFRLTIYREM